MSATLAAPTTWGAYGSVPVQVNRRGVLCPAAFAEWLPYDSAHGGAVLYRGALYDAPDAPTPLLFPQRADANGLIQVWAAAPVRLVVSAWLPGYPAVRQTLDVQFTADVGTGGGGTPGPTGPPGPPGEPGEPGPVGPAGEDGAPGVAGPQGIQGPAGAASTVPGPQGPAGPAGADGAPGSTGPKGDTGDPGAQGIQGPAGTAGATGAQGPAGPGVPAGGTTSQVLTKTSATDYATAWQTPAAGGGAFVDEAGDTMTGALILQGAAATTNVLQAKLAADTQPRFRSDANGRLEWGAGGASAVDKAIFRASSTQFQVIGSWVPDTTNSYNLGSSGSFWADTYSTNYTISNTGTLRLGTTLMPSTGTVRMRNTALLAWRNAADNGTFTLGVDASDRLAYSGTAFQLGTTPAASGAVRLPNNQALAWRNAGNTADLALVVDATNALTFNGAPVAVGSFLPLTGGTLTGDLVVSKTTPVVAVKLTADTQPRSQLADNGLWFGPGGATVLDIALQRTGPGSLAFNPSVAKPWAGGVTSCQIGPRMHLVSGGTDAYLSYNAYFDGTSFRLIGADAASRLYLLGATLSYQHTGSAAADTAVGWVTRLAVAATGTVTVVQDAGQVAYGIARGDQGLAGDGSTNGMEIKGFSGPMMYFRPVAGFDNAASLGSASQRWNVVYAGNGTIQTSTYEAKEDFTPLDPAACAAAVTETDWLSYRYKPAVAQIESDDERETDERTARYLVESVSERSQKGYVLRSPDHKVHDLFGQPDRESASPSSDLAVVACALQHALAEIELLKAKLP